MDISALGAAPISVDSPAGADAKYEPEYEALTAEIAKLSSVSRSEPISWQAVADNGAVILAEKSKDISVAAYMAVAIQHTRGMEGLLDGIRLLHGICSNFWNDAFPPKAKPRRRLNAYEWWHEHAVELLRKEGQPPISTSLSSSIIEAADDLDRLIETLMEEAHPLRDIKEAMRAIPVIPEEKQPEQPVAAAPEPEPERPKERETAPAAVLSAHEPPKPAAPPAGDAAGALSAFIDAARVYAFMLRSEDPANYLAWQLPRVALWGRMTALPPADASGETRIPAPDSERIGAVERLLSGRNWLKAAIAADDLFPSFPLCIDLQRMADEALGNLGPAFAAARARLRAETTALLERLPGLISLTYDGGEPFVSPAARAWLEELAQRDAQEARGGAAGGGRIETAIAEAREALSGGDAAAALKKLEDAQGPSAAGNIRLRSEALRILCAQREIKAAAALGRAMIEEMEQSGLTKLEPDAAVEAMTAVCRAFELAGDAAGAEQIREKLAWLRPSAVLGWS